MGLGLDLGLAPGLDLRVRGESLDLGSGPDQILKAHRQTKPMYASRVEIQPCRV